MQGKDPDDCGSRGEHSAQPSVYVLGCGAVGMALAAALAGEGRPTVAVRTSGPDQRAARLGVSLRGISRARIPIETVPLEALGDLAGIVVIAAKAHANERIAERLKRRGVEGPVVLLQNGMGVERPFLQSRHFRQVCRGVLYLSAQKDSGDEISLRVAASAPLGVLRGNEEDLEPWVRALTTRWLPFHAERDIHWQVWRKTIVNSVFNTICPLLEADNGIFVREPLAAGLAREIVAEGVALAERHGAVLDGAEVMTQVLAISESSQGQWISTLQDLKSGRPTEMEFLNLELARLASAAEPKVDLRRTELLGRLVAEKSRLALAGRRAERAIFRAAES